MFLVFKMVPDGESDQTEIQVSAILILFQREIKISENQFANRQPFCSRNKVGSYV